MYSFKSLFMSHFMCSFMCLFMCPFMCLPNTDTHNTATNNI